MEYFCTSSHLYSLRSKPFPYYPDTYFLMLSIGFVDTHFPGDLSFFNSTFKSYTILLSKHISTTWFIPHMFGINLFNTGMYGDTLCCHRMSSVPSLIFAKWLLPQDCPSSLHLLCLRNAACAVTEQNNFSRISQYLITRWFPLLRPNIHYLTRYLFMYVCLISAIFLHSILLVLVLFLKISCYSVICSIY